MEHTTEELHVGRLLGIVVGEINLQEQHSSLPDAVFGPENHCFPIDNVVWVDFSLNPRRRIRGKLLPVLT